MSEEKIPFRVETRRIIELLANQIYQSPLAMLRENIQNAYDAILMRAARNEPGFLPQITVELASSEIKVRDNGVGMTKDVIRNNFWMAGSSGKNNDAARAAGVVGTFGIGGMANFGIAGELKIETESIDSLERHISHVKVDDLELNKDCISCNPVPSTREFGTEITAILLPGQNLDIAQATAYIKEFASALPVPLHVNGALISQQPVESLVPMVPQAWQHEGQDVALGSHLVADVKIVGSQNAEIWTSLDNIRWAGNALKKRHRTHSDL
jgi:molecular chaperone HtpG